MGTITANIPKGVKMLLQQQSRRVKRSVNTMQSMVLAHQYKGQTPHLTAITTLYLNLLNADTEAGSQVWGLFYKVALLPLRVQAHVNKCKLQPELRLDSCGGTRVIKVGGKRQAISGCHHQLIDTTIQVQLVPLDQHRLQHGQTVTIQPLITPQSITQWWASELQVALKASGVA